ncbi:Thioredoxin/glutathione peroxidase BtuE [Pseudomonas sp. Teo4]|nr:Thioredoxin/glutathione peroxidase BtuE [Pseudomonas sp. Teo4]
MAGSILDIPCVTLGGEHKVLGDFSGKAVLVVNTASQCGFTPQYKGLEQLWQAYRDRGLVVLGFPCNQFGKQEPGDAREIAQFCERNFGVSFPLFRKIEVNGPGAHPLFVELKQRAPACWAPRRSSGTSPSSCSTRPVARSNAMARPPSLRRWRRISSVCSAADWHPVLDQRQ